MKQGAWQSAAPETIAFVKGLKIHDLTWIERDIVLKEIDRIAYETGFVKKIKIVPILYPSALQAF